MSAARNRSLAQVHGRRFNALDAIYVELPANWLRAQEWDASSKGMAGGGAGNAAATPAPLLNRE